MCVCAVCVCVGGGGGGSFINQTAFLGVVLID